MQSSENFYFINELAKGKHMSFENETCPTCEREPHASLAEYVKKLCKQWFDNGIKCGVATLLTLQLHNDEVTPQQVDYLLSTFGITVEEIIENKDDLYDDTEVEAFTKYFNTYKA